MYDDYIESLEDLDTAQFSSEQKEALEEAKDALAFVQGINDALGKVGFPVSKVPDLDTLENMLDALTCELSSAVILLCSIEGVEDRLRSISRELLTANKEEGATVDPSIILAYSKLAERIERTRPVLQAQLK
jgi:uncharacterized protein (DUF2342 family)